MPMAGLEELPRKCVRAVGLWLYVLGTDQNTHNSSFDSEHWYHVCDMYALNVRQANVSISSIVTCAHEH